MKEIITAVGTLAIAVGIGFVMQSSETAKERYGTAARPDIAPADQGNPAEGEQLSGNASADILLEVQGIELTSGSEVPRAPILTSEAGVFRVSVPSGADLPPTPDDMPAADGCKISANASVAPGAMVNISLDAPCAPNERLTVHHNGMMFTETTGPDGALEIAVPALTEMAVFIMAFAGGDGAVAQIAVPDVANYDRVALQWRGSAGFQLHAREFGADYGQDGHVWSGVEQNPAGMIEGKNGFVIQLGDALSAEPLVAEVYTFPTNLTSSSGTIDLSVEAEVTSLNCGLEIEAQTLEMMAGGKMKTQDLTLAVPGCDTVGSFLVLNNLVSDLKVASN